MKRFSAPTLEEAYEKACRDFDCSIGELQYEVIQYPSKGILGLFAKEAIIVAVSKKPIIKEVIVEKEIPKENIKEEILEDIKELSTESEVIEEIEEIIEKAVIEEPENSTEAVDEILNDFFEEKPKKTKESIKLSPDEIQKEIEESLKNLIKLSCFDIDVVEVDIIDGCACIFMDGDDAPLLIGKEGYRYNALSYLLYNWIQPKYDLRVQLEIASFVTTQREMIKNFIQPVIEHIKSEGWGRTRPLEGVLIHLALEELRKEFPDKYVAIKRDRDGNRYILVAEFKKTV